MTTTALTKITTAIPHVTAADYAADIDTLAHLIHNRGCGCGAAPDRHDHDLAADIHTAGYRRDRGARNDLADLLLAVANAWHEFDQQPATSTGEKLRWTAVCVTAARIATRWNRP